MCIKYKVRQLQVTVSVSYLHIKEEIKLCIKVPYLDVFRLVDDWLRYTLKDAGARGLIVATMVLLTRPIELISSQMSADTLKRLPACVYKYVNHILYIFPCRRCISSVVLFIFSSMSPDSDCDKWWECAEALPAAPRARRLHFNGFNMSKVHTK